MLSINIPQKGAQVIATENIEIIHTEKTASHTHEIHYRIFSGQVLVIIGGDHLTDKIGSIHLKVGENDKDITFGSNAHFKQQFVRVQVGDFNNKFAVLGPDERIPQELRQKADDVRSLSRWTNIEV